MVEFILFILIICLGAYAYGTKQAVFRVANEGDRANYILSDEILRLDREIKSLKRKAKG